MEEVSPKKTTPNAIKEPMKLSKPKLVEMMLIKEPMVTMEQFPRQ
jgi:hypothetical protein